MDWIKNGGKFSPFGRDAAVRDLTEEDVKLLSKPPTFNLKKHVDDFFNEVKVDPTANTITWDSLTGLEKKVQPDAPETAEDMRTSHQPRPMPTGVPPGGVRQDQKGGFTPPIGPSKVAPASFGPHFKGNPFFRGESEKDMLTEKDVAESFEKTKGAEMIFQVQKNRGGGNGFRQGLMAAEEVVRKYQSELAKNGLSTIHPATTMIFSTLLSRLGKVLMSDNVAEMKAGTEVFPDKSTEELSNLLQPVISRLLTEARYSEEMAVRGLLVRSERLQKAEQDYQFLKTQNANLYAKVAVMTADHMKEKKDAEVLRTTWASKDGRKLKAHEFENGHLLNTIRFIERAYESDMEDYRTAEDDDWDADLCVHRTVPELPPIYATLVAEARKRKLLLQKDKIILDNPTFREEP